MLSLSGPVFAEPMRMNTGSLVSALNNVNSEIRNLHDLTIEDIRVVAVEDSINNNRVLNNQTDIAVLQDFLNNNNVEIIKYALNNVNIDDVVAIDVLSGGDVVVFVHPQ